MRNAPRQQAANGRPDDCWLCHALIALSL